MVTGVKATFGGCGGRGKRGEVGVSTDCDTLWGPTTGLPVGLGGWGTGVRGFRLKILKASGSSLSAGEVGEDTAVWAVREDMAVLGAVSAAMENGREDTGTDLLGLREDSRDGTDADVVGRVLTDVPVFTD